MDINGEELIPLEQARVWAALNSPEVLKASIPGCESLEGTLDEYRIVMLATVGPVRARFNGKLKVTDIKPLEAYTLVFEGSGGVAGFGKGRAEVTLSSVAEGTRLTYAAQAQVGGKIAQVGSRLIDGVASRMATEFFQRFKAQIVPVGPVESALTVQAKPEARRNSIWSLLAFWRCWRRRPKGC